MKIDFNKISFNKIGFVKIILYKTNGALLMNSSVEGAFFVGFIEHHIYAGRRNNHGHIICVPL